MSPASARPDHSSDAVLAGSNSNPGPVGRTRGRWPVLVWCGVLAPVVFTATFTLAGLDRPGYRAALMFVSELSLGPGGWIQQANFLFTGALIVGFGLQMGGRRQRVLRILVLLLGVWLAASGLVDTDPAAMFSQATTHGRVHGVLGALVFATMPVICFLAAGGRPVGRATRFSRVWRGWSRGVPTALLALIVLLKIAEFPQTALFAWKGLVQRCDLILFMVWLITFTVLVARSPSDHASVTAAVDESANDVGTER